MIKKKYKPSHLLLAIFTAFWVVFAFAFGFKECRKKSNDLPKIVKRGVIRVCGEEDRFSFYTDKNGSHGFHYELAKAFSDKYNLNLEYSCESNLSKRIKLLTSGKCDILTGPLPVIAELSTTIAYTEPIMESYIVLVQRTKEYNKGIKPIRDQILLGGKYIAVTSNSPNILRIHNLSNEISDSIGIREFPRYKSKDLIHYVAKGILDYSACDRFVANAYLKDYPEIDIQTNLGLTQFQAWAVRPEKNTLLDSLNAFISDYKKSPAFARLLKKYSN